MSHCEPAAPLALSLTVVLPVSEIQLLVARHELTLQSGCLRTTLSAPQISAIATAAAAASVDAPCRVEVRLSPKTKDLVPTHRTQSSDVPKTRMPIGLAVNTPPTRGSSQS